MSQVGMDTEHWKVQTIKWKVQTIKWFLFDTMFNGKIIKMVFDGSILVLITLPKKNVLETMVGRKLPFLGKTQIMHEEAVSESVITAKKEKLRLCCL